jgi:hypothetical protein
MSSGPLPALMSSRFDRHCLINPISLFPRQKGKISENREKPLNPRKQNLAI